MASRKTPVPHAGSRTRLVEGRTGPSLSNTAETSSGGVWKSPRSAEEVFKALSTPRVDQLHDATVLQSPLKGIGDGQIADLRTLQHDLFGQLSAPNLVERQVALFKKGVD